MTSIANILNQTKRIKLKAYFLTRNLTSFWRVLPDVFLIGVQKGGTTSLYDYLVQHPNILPGFKKAPKFFDHNYYRGTMWYRAHYPTFFKFFKNGEVCRDFHLIDASQDTIYHPISAERISKLIHSNSPRFVVMFRNPVDRAFSHYQHRVRIGEENLSFEDAIKSEPERISNIRERLINGNENIPLYNFLNYSYLARGLYAQQIEIWFNHFPRENFLLLNSEDFFSNPETGYLKVLDFLKIPIIKPINFKNSNPGGYKDMDPKIRSFLIEYFNPFNKTFFELIDKVYDWDK